jgi:hypothetical protein
LRATTTSTSGSGHKQGIVHFVVGSGGKLAPGDIDARSPLTARGYDGDLAFLVAEIDGDQMFFNAVSRTGAIIDSGIVLRRRTPDVAPSLARLISRPPDDGSARRPAVVSLD